MAVLMNVGRNDHKHHFSRLFMSILVPAPPPTRPTRSERGPMQFNCVSPARVNSTGTAVVSAEAIHSFIHSFSDVINLKNSY